MKTLIAKFIGNFQNWYDKPLQIEKWVVIKFDMVKQIESILQNHYTDILQYQEDMKLDNGDILCGQKTLSLEVLHLHLLISLDGANPYHKLNVSFWPVQCTMLDLPNYLRSRIQNALLIAILQCNEKPVWKTLLAMVMSHVPFGKELSFKFQCTTIRYKILLHAAVFDLPAMASVLQQKQFNGYFGCLYCIKPGENVPSGKGHAMIYAHTGETFEPKNYTKFSELAHSSGQSIFDCPFLAV